MSAIHMASLKSVTENKTCGSTPPGSARKVKRTVRPPVIHSHLRNQAETKALRQRVLKPARNNLRPAIAATTMAARDLAWTRTVLVFCRSIGDRYPNRAEDGSGMATRRGTQRVDRIVSGPGEPTACIRGEQALSCEDLPAAEWACEAAMYDSVSSLATASRRSP